MLPPAVDMTTASATSVPVIVGRSGATGVSAFESVGVGVGVGSAVSSVNNTEDGERRVYEMVSELIAAQREFDQKGGAPCQPISLRRAR